MSKKGEESLSLISGLTAPVVLCGIGGERETLRQKEHNTEPKNNHTTGF